MALDPGTRRIGVAISDELRQIAQPLEFIPAEPFDAFSRRFQELLASMPCERIVVGLPRNMDGSYGPAADRVKEFIGRLAQITNLPIRTWDERLTSTQANKLLIQGGVRRQDRKEKVDAVAAAILLQSFLDASAGAS